MQTQKYLDIKLDLEKKKRKSFWNPITIGILILLLLITCSSLIYVNIYLQTKKKISFQDLITILFFNKIKSASANSANSATKDELNIGPAQRAIWICLASMIAATALVISGSAIQSITQNPLADTTTLGFIDSNIFGIIVMKGIVTTFIMDVANYHILYFSFALIGGIFSLLMLSLVFNKPQHQSYHLKIILTGLVLNMVFKTFTYLIKTYNPNASNTSLKLAMGGAENIYGIYTNQFAFVKWCALVVAICFALTILFSRKFNIFELGEDQAKTLGVNVKVFKIFCYCLILITTTISVVLVGNVAFLGLICTHVIRSILKTRKYQIIIPCGSVLACCLLLFGILLNSLLPFIASSILILFLGGCILFYLTLTNKEL